eukprot:CAMPEP_0201284486 /NCGR_PEP_ID=MMETSP1317-20130820/75841_1 /ASSEMBLY_ACC=CAM_ASM_000770 /TAXON_ID=187299 /ORGANISM="Undescribed Undescribed, Strain Undescribed" /LENGTH=34 /DNA_ID= /DNA_START= /DNA_END= /DNA_ORIENTATION=
MKHICFCTLRSVQSHSRLLIQSVLFSRMAMTRAS